MGDAFDMGTEREEKEQRSGEDGDAPHQDAASVSTSVFFLIEIYSIYKLGDSNGFKLYVLM